MDYEEMSDYKINQQVLWITRGKNSITYRDRNSPNEVICHGMQGTFDPCNNPNDAWPIILENNITLELSPDCLYEAYSMVNGVRFSAQFSEKSRALRAAMICFLMMQDNI